MCLFSQKKAYNALKSKADRLEMELDVFKRRYNELLDKYEKSLDEQKQLKGVVSTLKDEVGRLTPIRDIKGRYIKRS